MIDDLLYRFNAGDRTAFEEVYSLYVRRLVYYLRCLGMETTDAEDMVEDVFLTLFQKHKQATDLTYFLYRCLRNKLIDLKRKDLPKFTDDIPETEDEPYVHAMLVDIIFQSIESLPPGQRVIMKDLYFYNMTIEEIAARLGISPQTVRNQKTKALNWLREKHSKFNT